jgi:uncharacterized GH25 family protein
MGLKMIRLYTLLVMLSLSTLSFAHFHILIPDKASLQKGDNVVFDFKFGHPFECELQDTLKPEKVILQSPKGSTADITNSFKPLKDKSGKKETTFFRGEFKTESRGDHVIVVKSQPVWMESEKEFIQDTIKVVVHVQTQNNWDAGPITEFELMPITRPYGILPGMIARFQINEQARKKLSPQKGWMFEIEKWNPIPPKNLPPDELITFTSKADDSGIVSFSAPSSGWWSITTEARESVTMKNNETRTLRQRTTFWYFVDTPQTP